MRLNCISTRTARLRFQSTHPLRDATYTEKQWGKPCKISIHAPLTGCDSFYKYIIYVIHNFNPRTPYGMRRFICKHGKSVKYFNPRTPYGMRHTDDFTFNIFKNDFNPRTPYGMRHCRSNRRCITCKFQSTHPLRDATRFINNSCETLPYFNPRTPYGMRLLLHVLMWWKEKISIHAPLTGCDIAVY